MNTKGIRRRLAILGLVTTALLLTAGTAWMLFTRSPQRGLPYRSDFSAAGGAEWNAYGGTWNVEGDRINNSSDERGAKLVSGSPYWRDYMLDADLRFLGAGGDVGVMVRSRNEEEGVDSYNGYYIGLRSGDNSLVIGRAGFGWIEAPAVRLPKPVQLSGWYHLKVVAVGCSIAAAATDLSNRQSSYVAIRDPSCAQAGRVGLRSLATGGEWRNVTVAAAGSRELQDLLRHSGGVEQLSFLSEASYNHSHSFVEPTDTGPVTPLPGKIPSPTDIGALRTLAPNAQSDVVVRGVVTLLHPALYVQDATGGVEVSIPDAAMPLLSLGDEVEVRGDARLGLYSSSIMDAKLRLLWDRTPASPVSVTAWQAASGGFSGLLVETQGGITGMSRDGQVLILDLNSGDQSFKVLIRDPLHPTTLQDLPLHSQVRVRGVCVLNNKYTHRLTPFALLLRSADDVDVVGGPPWWTVRHLTQEAASLLLALLLFQTYHSRMERRRRSAITDERERLAHELHDTLAQSFAGVGYQLFGIRNSLRMRSQANFERVDQQLEVATDFVRRTHEEASLSIALLRSDKPEIENLQKALERCAAQLTFGGSIQVSVTCEGQERRTLLRTTDALFHIGREALANAVRHAKAKHIDIRIEYERASILLAVEDDGVGFERDLSTRRLGLKSMERRAASIRADFHILSAQGAGTRVVVRAPSPALRRTALLLSRWPAKLRRRNRQVALEQGAGNASSTAART